MLPSPNRKLSATTAIRVVTGFRGWPAVCTGRVGEWRTRRSPSGFRLTWKNDLAGEGDRWWGNGSSRPGHTATRRDYTYSDAREAFS